MQPTDVFEITPAGLVKCVGDPRAVFAAQPLRVLEFVRLCACSGRDAQWDSFLAAMEACPQLAAVYPAGLRGDLQAILLSDCPQALAPVLEHGGLAGAGLRPPAPCLHPLARVPATLLGRWWALLTFCRAEKEEVVQKLGYTNRLLEDLGRMDTLYRGGVPGDLPELKRRVKAMEDFDVDQAARAFETLDPAWSRGRELWQQLLEKGEPFWPKHLAAPLSSLLALGMPLRLAQKVQAALLDAVVEKPELNQYQLLLDMADGLARVL